MSVRTMLEKHRWVRVSAKKMGAFKIVKWQDPKTGEVVPQYYAVLVQRERNKAKKNAKATLQTVLDESEEKFRKGDL
jgi:hypothetical protein